MVVQQCKFTYCHRSVHLKLVKMINSMFYILYYKKNAKKSMVSNNVCDENIFQNLWSAPLDISRIKIQNSIVGDNVTGLHSILFDETRN